MDRRAAKILVVDDEIGICRSCAKILSREGYKVSYALSGYEALSELDRGPADLVITDLKMSSMGGMELLRRVKEAHPDAVVIVITGYATVSSAVEVMRMGACDFLPKPFTPEELRNVVRRALSERALRLLRRESPGMQNRPGAVRHQLVGESPKIRSVVSMIGKVAPTDSTVLVYGESGTGKELVARAIHANSARSDKVFFAVDCGTLTGNLLESELFGHVKGAFTGAFRHKEGIFKMADHGTVFLDEISNIGLEVQSRLLRFIETQEFRPLGATAKQKVDVRLIFATNRDLMEMVQQGALREDFYYRIFVYPIFTPALRERKGDVMAIACHFLDQFRTATGKQLRGFSQEGLARLTAYDWPGNVRQLRNVIERAVILCEGEEITLKDLPDLGETCGRTPHIPENNEELKRVKKEAREAAVREVEKGFVLQALMKNDWNITRAARQVGVQRPNFQNLMKKHGISASSHSSSPRPEPEPEP